MTDGLRQDETKSGCISVADLQRRLDSGDPSDINDELIHYSLGIMERRLVRVRQLGGQFREIDFSPQMKALLPTKSELVTNRPRSEVLLTH